MLPEALVYVPLEGLFARDAEMERLRKELDTLARDLGGVEGRLANPSFVERAPAHVVEEARSRLATLEDRRGKLQELLAELE